MYFHVYSNGCCSQHNFAIPQILPVAAHILSIPERKPAATQTDAVLIGSLPPLSATTFYIKQEAGK